MVRFEFPTINSNDVDTLVCEGDNLMLSVSTDLEDHTVEWYKDDALLEGEDQLLFIKNGITSNDWGII